MNDGQCQCFYPENPTSVTRATMHPSGASTGHTTSTLRARNLRLICRTHCGLITKDCVIMSGEQARPMQLASVNKVGSNADNIYSSRAMTCTRSENPCCGQKMVRRRCTAISPSMLGTHTNTYEYIATILESQAGETNSLSSPLATISWTMSSPPTNSPLMMSCGNVGQLLNSLRPNMKHH